MAMADAPKEETEVCSSTSTALEESLAALSQFLTSWNSTFLR